MLLLSLLVCKLPEPQILPEPTWQADCDGWDCPDATTVEWGSGWVACDWECTTWGKEQGVDVSVSIYLRSDGCWHEEAVSVTQRDCSWVSY